MIDVIKFFYEFYMVERIYINNNLRFIIGNQLYKVNMIFCGWIMGGDKCVLIG